MTNQGRQTATVKLGSPYTIPKGYHDGTGTVTAVAPTLTLTGYHLEHKVAKQVSYTFSAEANSTYLIIAAYNSSAAWLNPTLTASNLTRQTTGNLGFGQQDRAEIGCCGGVVCELFYNTRSSAINSAVTWKPNTSSTTAVQLLIFKVTMS